MSKARLVITAIEVEGRTAAEVIADYGVSRSWLYELLARYRAEGDAAFEPRSRRPHTSPRATPPRTIELVLRIRKQLAESGLDAGADTIGWHLTHHHQTTLSGPRSTGSWPGTAPPPPTPPNGRSPPTSASPPNNPTRPGSRTSPTTGSPRLPAP